MILEMIAWRDPNVIKVAAFYGDDLKVNYAGKLASDPHPLVSQDGCAGVEHATTGWQLDGLTCLACLS
jgi:hypothetical protein